MNPSMRTKSNYCSKPGAMKSSGSMPQKGKKKKKSTKSFTGKKKERLDDFVDAVEDLDNNVVRLLLID